MQDVAKKIVDFFAANFPNGIRDDFIDTNRVRKILSPSKMNCPPKNFSPSPTI